MRILQEMKQFIYSPKKPGALRPGSGQALIELAVFASMFLIVLSLLVRYGLSLNYYQQGQMSAFRKGLNEAYALGRGTVRSASLVVLEDRRIPNTQGPFGISSRVPVMSSLAASTSISARQPVGASASLVWSESLNPEEYEYNDSELPRHKYIIDGEEKEYTTAAYRGVLYKRGDQPCPLNQKPHIKVKVDDHSDPNGPQWRWQEINAKDNYNSDEKVIKYDIDGDGEKDAISLADIGIYNCATGNFEYDGKEEHIVKVEIEEAPRVGFVSMLIIYLDPQEGDLDLTIDSKDLWEHPNWRRQGLYATYLGPETSYKPDPDNPDEYTIHPGDEKLMLIKPGTSFQRIENDTEHKTITKVNTQDIIFRTIIKNKDDSGNINKEGVEEYVYSNLPEKREFTWQFPWSEK